jgi:hypothetical protein
MVVAFSCKRRGLCPSCTSRLAIAPFARVRSYTACIDERRRNSAERWRSHFRGRDRDQSRCTGVNAAWTK